MMGVQEHRRLVFAGEAFGIDRVPSALGRQKLDVGASRLLEKGLYRLCGLDHELLVKIVETDGGNAHQVHQGFQIAGHVPVNFFFYFVKQFNTFFAKAIMFILNLVKGRAKTCKRLVEVLKPTA